MRLLAVTCLLLLTLAGLCASTQYVAANLHHAPQLGPPWVVFGDLRLHPPWDWIIWDRLYGARSPSVSQRRRSHHARKCRRMRGRDRRRPWAQVLWSKPCAWQLPLGDHRRDPSSGPLVRDGWSSHSVYGVGPRLLAICRIFKTAVCRRIMGESAAIGFWIGSRPVHGIAREEASRRYVSIASSRPKVTASCVLATARPPRRALARG